MISTHVLDTQIGQPAIKVGVRLEILSDSTWIELETSQTNSDGRCVFGGARVAGTYRLTFDTQEYFSRGEEPFFYPIVPVVFIISDTTRKYHVPLLLNSFGYSTYRGS